MEMLPIMSAAYYIMKASTFGEKLFVLSPMSAYFVGLQILYATLTLQTKFKS